MTDRSVAAATPPAGHPASADPGVSWIALRLHDASVAVARRFAEDVLSGHVRDGDHVHTVLLLVSEVVTNGLRAARALAGEGLAPPWREHDRPVRLGLAVTDRYVHLRVTDPDRRPITPETAPNPDPDSGWGLGIVDALSSARWVTYEAEGKTVHVLIPAPGVEPVTGDPVPAG